MKPATIRTVLNAALALAALSAWAAAASAQESGAFFTLVNTYAFSEGPRQGERYLVRARQSLTVTGFTTDSEGITWYKAIDPDRTLRLKGAGWVALDPHELTERGSQTALVFAEPITRLVSAPAGLDVPASDIQLANASQPSTLFPEIVWQKVNYETTVPAALFVRAATGIYRPFVSEKFISDAHADMVTQGLDNDRQRRLLSGVVRAGDSPQDVRWALGDPLQQEESVAAELNILVWHYAGLQVRFENNVVKKIN